MIQSCGVSLQTQLMTHTLGSQIDKVEQFFVMWNINGSLAV